jgi:hypothetical protein
MGWTVQGFEFLPTRIPRPPSRNNTDTEQAQFLVRSNIISIANGVEVVHWFHYSGDNAWRYTYNMFECDTFSSPMKTIPAFSAMSNFLANAEFVRKLAEGNGDQYAYLFSEGEKQVITAWTTCQKSTMFIETQAGSFDVYDIMGNKIAAVNTDGGISVVDISGSPVYLVSSDGAFDNTEIENNLSLELRKLPRSEPRQYVAVVKVSNPFGQKITADIELLVPTNIASSRQNAQIRLEPHKQRTIAFPITVQSAADAITEYITAVANVEMGDRQYALQSRKQLQYTKPLPKPASGVWLEAEKPAEINFENSPAWLPNQFRSYGGDNLRFRATNPVKPNEQFIAEYEFEIGRQGEYSILVACSALGDCEDSEYLPALSVQINDGEFISCDASSQIGSNWIYSTHKNIWWRFRNAWHDFAKVSLPKGTHRLKLRLGTPPSGDYNYLTIDAITILNEEEKQQFVSELEK